MNSYQSLGWIHMDPCCYLEGFCTQGWSPEPENYKELPLRRPEGPTGRTQSPYLQVDLLRSHNITGEGSFCGHYIPPLSGVKELFPPLRPTSGVLSQGGGLFGTFVSSFFLQFSQDGGQWYTYKELVTDGPPRTKVSSETSPSDAVALF